MSPTMETSVGVQEPILSVLSSLLSLPFYLSHPLPFVSLIPPLPLPARGFGEAFKALPPGPGIAVRRTTFGAFTAEKCF